MVKLQRNYSLSIELPPDGTGATSNLIIEPPFTLELDITRNDLSSTNTASLRIYNLSAQHRNQIRKDQFDGDNLRRVTLRAGYGNNLPIVLNGNITQAWSTREGTSFITQIEAFDGGYASGNAVFTQQFPEGTPQKDVVDSMVDSLAPYGVNKGTIGEYPGTISKGNSYGGNTVDLLREITGGEFFIDNGIAHCLGDQEVLEGEIFTINSASGLLGTPIRELLFFRFDMIFEPRLFLGQQVLLDSSTGVNFNGYCKVISLHHRAMIAQSISGDAITSVGLTSGTFTSVKSSTAS